MRNLLALAAAAVLIFAGVGWYLGWYRIGTVATEPGHNRVTIDIDRDRISEDLSRGKTKLRDILDSKDGKGTQAVEQAPAPPVGTPKATQPQAPGYEPSDGGSWEFPGFQDPRRPR